MLYLSDLLFIIKMKRKYRTDLKKTKKYNTHINKKDIVYIIRRSDPNVGIFSCILTFLTHLRYADEKGYIPVIDMMNYDNEYLYDNELGVINAWEFYFEQPKDTTVEQAYGLYKKIKISSGHFQKQFIPSNAFLCSKESDDSIIWKNLWKKYINVNSQTKQYLESMYNNIEKKCHGNHFLGVLCRGTDYFHYTNAQGNIDIELKLMKVIEFVGNIAEKKECQYIFLATEDQDIFDRFFKAFAERLLYFDDERLQSDEDQLLGQAWKKNNIDLKKKGLNYILNFYVLSQAKFFVGARTSASVFLPIVGEKEYMFFYDLVNIEDEIRKEQESV